MPVGPTANAGEPSTTGGPTITVSTFLPGLDIPWDIAWVGDIMLVTERDKERVLARMPGGEVRVLLEAPAGMWHSGETGLMGIVVDPDFSSNRRIYTCHGFDNGTTRDIRVVRWGINAGFTAATHQATILGSIEITSGRHGGCRMRFGKNGALYIGTGDSAVGTNPQDLGSPNGKTLRIDPSTGAPWPGNPFIDSSNLTTRKIFTYGHRNVQGMALRRGNQMWSVEHGTYRDDEVNKLKPGGNYGWNPVPGYDESKPMTDHSLPGHQINAKWSSGDPTIATSGAAWLRGDVWGAWKGRMVTAALVGSELRLLEFDTNGTLLSQLSIPEFDGDYGRLRAVQMGPDHQLFLSTSNGGGTDRILKVTAS